MARSPTITVADGILIWREAPIIVIAAAHGILVWREEPVVILFLRSDRRSAVPAPS